MLALQEAAAGSCRVVVLAGAGEAFCAGLDLSALQGMNDRSDAEHTADAERVARLFRTLYELPKPTIASVHGAASCRRNGTGDDLRLYAGGRGAKFGYTEVKIGFVPALGVGVSDVADWREAGARSAADADGCSPRKRRIGWDW